MPPKFFITHSWNDKKFAQRLCDDLRRDGLDGFFDVYSVKPGDLIPEEINRGLEACDVYVPILSFASLESPWCKEEVNAAIMLSNKPSRNGRPRIISVLIEECQDKMPALLQTRLYIHFAGRYDDAFQELLTKGIGLSRPSRPMAEQPAVPASRPSTPVPAPRLHQREPPYLGGTRVRDAIISRLLGIMVVASAIGFLAIGIYLLWALASIVGGLISGLGPAMPTPAGLPAAAALPSAMPSQVSSVLPSATPSPSPTGRFGIGSTKIAKDGSLMMYVPAGEFLMGRGDADSDAWPSEKPQHSVYLDAFWISKYELTNALYKKCVDAGRCSASGYWPWPERTIPAGKENYPVALSWNQATAYAQWAGGRLPTEAEWEKAACWDETNKAERVYAWGNVFDVKKANLQESGISDTTPVGKYSPQGDSAYGVSDMTGNAWEWVMDWFDENYYKNSPKQNPQGPASGTSHVLRGASERFPQVFARCTYRYAGTPPDAIANDFGLRLAESVSP